MTDLQEINDIKERFFYAVSDVDLDEFEKNVLLCQKKGIKPSSIQIKGQNCFEFLIDCAVDPYGMPCGHSRSGYQNAEISDVIKMADRLIELGVSPYRLSKPSSETGATGSLIDRFVDYNKDIGGYAPPNENLIDKARFLVRFMIQHGVKTPTGKVADEVCRIIKMPRAEYDECIKESYSNYINLRSNRSQGRKLREQKNDRISDRRFASFGVEFARTNLERAEKAFRIAQQDLQDAFLNRAKIYLKLPKGTSQRDKAAQKLMIAKGWTKTPQEFMAAMRAHQKT